MNRVPTHREREVLRYLAVGMRLERGGTFAYVTTKGVIVTKLRAHTVKLMEIAGWLGEDPERGCFLTMLGRDVAECGVFVRAFSESTSLSTPSTPTT
jgi:hypothetical protein